MQAHNTSLKTLKLINRLFDYDNNTDDSKGFFVELLIQFWYALLELSYAMAPYILFGLLFAGILHELVPESIVTKHLGKDNVGSVVKSTLFGIPLPVCSCGVIPLAAGIKKSGASKGATLSFLISTPITGVDSILATYGIFGWIFTLYRIVTSMVIAIVAGILTNFFDKEQGVESREQAGSRSEEIAGSGEQGAKRRESFSVHPANTQNISFSALSAQRSTFPIEEQPSCCSSSSCCDSDKAKRGFSLSAALRYGFITLLCDIAKPLFWGLLIGAAITVAIPDNLSEILVNYSWLSYLIVIAIAVPMYVCATASLPIAAALMLSGVSAGAAFVFLSAGPATNTVTIGVVKKMLGTRSLYIYLGSIIVGSMLFGLGLDTLFDASNIDPASLVHMDEHGGITAILSSIVLWGFILWFMVQPYVTKKENCEGGSCCGN